MVHKALPACSSLHITHLCKHAQVAGADVPYMVCVCSGYCVVEEETRLGWPCVGGAIILALPCITGLNTCCAWRIQEDSRKIDNISVRSSCLFANSHVALSIQY